MSEEISDILESLERIRKRDYPELPADLVKQVARTEYEQMETNENPQREIRKMVQESFEEYK